MLVVLSFVLSPPAGPGPKHIEDLLLLELHLLDVVRGVRLFSKHIEEVELRRLRKSPRSADPPVLVVEEEDEMVMRESRRAGE